jgi:hypothetical protein
MVIIIGLDFTSNAGLIFSSREVAVTTAEEAWHV